MGINFFRELEVNVMKELTIVWGNFNFYVLLIFRNYKNELCIKKLIQKIELPLGFRFPAYNEQ
jgi:hypothetical protein